MAARVRSEISFASYSYGSENMDRKAIGDYGIAVTCALHYQMGTGPRSMKMLFDAMDTSGRRSILRQIPCSAPAAIAKPATLPFRGEITLGNRPASA